MRAIAPCGFLCDRCPAFEDNIKGQEDQRRAYEGWTKYWGIETSPEKVRCKGCRMERPQGYVYPEIGCKIKPCVESKGLDHCGHCPELPCEMMRRRFKDCEDVHSGWTGRISDEDKEKFLDPYRPREVLMGIAGRSEGAKPGHESSKRKRSKD